jgi:hypothetical protein
MDSRGEERLAAPWRESAARLTQLLASRADEEFCLAALKQINRRFGEHGYPGFLKLLLVVAESDHAAARQRLADCLALGLRRGDAPSGVLTSWGATRFWSTQTPMRAGMLPGNILGLAPRRQLDPLEYLTVWYSQRTHRPYLGELTYRECLARLLGLFDSSSTARLWYPLKIEADLAGIEGAFTRQTRRRLAVIAEGWKQGQPAGMIAAAAADAIAVETGTAGSSPGTGDNPS